MTTKDNQLDSSATSGELTSAHAKIYRDAIALVCEGWTLPSDARKVLETALWAHPAPQAATTEQAKPRYIPDSECKQGRCARQTVGCWGECNLRREERERVPVTVTYGGVAPAATTASASRDADELGHADTVLRVQEALGFTTTGYVSPDVILLRIQQAQQGCAPAPSREAAGDLAAMLSEVAYQAVRDAGGRPDKIAERLRVALAGRDAAVPLDLRQGFERHMSNRGEAVNYEGDGLYASKAVNDQADAFRAGVEFAQQGRSAAPQGVAGEARERFEELVRDLYNFQGGRHFALRLEKLLEQAQEQLDAALAGREAAVPLDEQARKERENAEFTEWWVSSGQQAAHDVVTENATHATWQERARRAALASAPQPAATDSEVGDGELPPLPKALYRLSPDSKPTLYDADQYRQGQREAIAFDRARREAASVALVGLLPREHSSARRAAGSTAGDAWISVEDRLPPVGEQVLVYVPNSQYEKVQIDTWDMQREAPVSFSSETIEIGHGWDDHEFEDITHWMPLAATPSTQSPAGEKGGA